MKKRIITLALAIIMVFETIMPVAGFAKETTPEQNNMVKVGTIDIKSYPQLDAKTAQEANRRKKQELNGMRIQGGVQLFSSPYFPNQDPNDKQKPLIFANVNAIFTTKGLDGGDFDWAGVFGKDENGKLNKAQIVFEQLDYKTSTRTGVKFFLKVDKDGTYTWSDSEGKPTKLPLYSTDLKPYKYEVLLDEDVTDHVKLLTARFFGTGGGYKFGQPDPATGEIVGNINLDLSLQQIASTKFTSKWNTGVVESERPTVEGSYLTGHEADPEDYGIFKFPSNDTDKTIIRNDQLDPLNPGEYSEYRAKDLDKTPTVGVADPDPDATDTYTLDRDNSRISYKGKNYKYDFNYNVINGGKLSMTEIIPLTFDANGGNFASITDPNAEQKIVKEVEYDKDLTEDVEKPKKDLETFKGWATTEKGKPLSEEDFKAAIKNIKEAKTFYAIWDNNDIVADELEVKESFKDGTGYVNDFIPTLDQLKGQVKIKDANGDPQPLANDDTFAIVDGTNEYTADGDGLKNYLYGKLQEKDDGNKPSRTETITAKITHANGTSQTVDIPIKVIKNIYEAKTLTEKPIYVPKDYVKVTVDPTTKAENPQKTYYYANPKAKVVIPGTDPTGKDDYKFIKWTMKADTATGNGADYNLPARHQFAEASTITAQYEKEKQGKVNIKYVDDKGNDLLKVSPSIKIDGENYPTEKLGKLSEFVTSDEFPAQGPKFEGYVFSSRSTLEKVKYKDENKETPDTITYTYYKKVTTEDKSANDTQYFAVIFDANKGEFGTDPKDQKIVYVLYNGNDATVEKVTFEEVRQAVEEEFGKPNKTNENFIEWQDKADKGSAVADNYEIKCPKWDWTTYPETGYTPETFYAHYGKASALISYLDLDGHKIDDKFKISTVEYPTEKEGTLDEAIKSDVFTAETAPKFIGYEFNRIELNPANAKYALDNKATIKIYYEKIDDIIPDTTPDDDSDKPDGYVTVTFEPGTNGTLDGETKFYVNPKADPVKTMAEITQPTITAKQGFKVADPKWKDAEDNALATATEITKDLTYTAQYTGLDDIIKDPTPEDNTDKPEGYVTVTFKPGDHGKLDNDTKDVVYYVNPKANPLKTMNDIAEPTVTPNTNYEVDTPKWKDASNVELDKTTEIKTDLTYTAQYKFTKDVVPQGPGEDKPVVPDNYVKVEFKQGEHGTILKNQITIYWVNPKVEVDLTEKAPLVQVNTEYKHTGWDKQLKDTFATATDITAKYLKKVETTNPNDTENYVKVDFKAETHGKIKDGETKEYWVLKDETVELKTPAVEAKTNYAFKEWKEPVQTSYSKDTTHNAVFAYTGENVVPQKPGEEKPDVPADFVKVVFDKGANGEFAADATTTYWVNPKVKVTVTAPKVEANPEYKHVAWTYNSKEVTTLESVTDTFKAEETTITAKYLKKVLEEEPQTDTDAYVEVKFNAESNGKLAEDKTEKSYWVLKDTPVSFTEPTVTANPGWKFIKYDPAVKTSYSEDTVHKAQYKKIIETKDPKDKDYVKVTFDPAAQGSIKAGSNAEVWVLKDETIDPTAITPQLEVKTGYAFKEWTPVVQTSYSEDTKHVASYTYNGKDVVPQKPGEDKPNVPNNFVKVTFVAGEHGSISNTETYIYWVKPEKEVTLNAPKVTANADYKHMAWTYGTKEVTNLQSVTDKFTEKETTITAKYLEKVVTENPNDTENYVKVTFKADADDQSPARGTLTGTTTYWVLKNTDVTVPAPKVTPNSGYTFTEWNPPVKTKYDADTTHTAQYKLKDKVLTEDPNDPDYIKVTFNANGGKIGLDETKDLWVLKGIATFADAKAKIATPIKEKATLKEWQDKASEGTAVEGTKVLSTANETFYAAWTNKGKIIDVTDPKVGPDPEYVRLTFKAGEGTFGKDGEGQDITEKIIDVLKDTSYTDAELLEKIKGFEDSAKANTPTKKFNAWDPAVPKTGLVETATFTAQYVDKDKIVDVEDPKVEPKEGYVRLTFDATTDGKIDGQEKKSIDVLSSLKYSDKDLQAKIASIKAVPNDNNKLFDKWTPAVPTDDTAVTKQTYRATYKDKDKNTIPATGNEKPDGYVTVRFLTNKNGKLTGETTYYVNPKAGKTMKDIKAPTITANDGYKVVDPKWKPNFTDETTIKEDKIFVANYDSLGKAEINYISMDTKMGTVSSASESIFENQKIAGSTATANPGYKFVKWTDVTGKEVSTDAKLVPDKKESATYIAIFEKEDTTADKVKKLFELEGVDLAAFVGDELTKDFWKDGVKSTEKSTSPFTEGEKAAIRDALKNATVSDASERNSDHEVSSPSKGTLEIKFADGSTLTVEQKLYVYDNGSQVPEDPKQPTPKDSLEVTYKAGEGVENFTDKTVLVKKGTKEADLPGKPDAKAKEGYKDLKWTADPAIHETNGIQENTNVTASAVVDNDYAKTSFTVTKVWANDVNPVPTMNFTLYRKVKGTQDDPTKVDGAEVKEITKENVIATWENLTKTNSEGKEYEYSVKESFAEKDVKNDNWILGEMVTDTNGNTITNKLKTVPGTGENPDDSKNFTGKLTITKVLANEPAQAKAPGTMTRMAVPEPTKFKFKVTGPYGYVSEEFELAAGESKTLENLAYGDYTVEETDSKGYTPEYSKAKETLTKDSPKGIITVTNKNVKSNDPQNPNIPSGQVIDVTVKKVWENVPQGTTTPQVKIELWRKGYDLNDKEYEQKVGEFTTAANNTANEETHEFTDLAKQDPSGRDFTYYAVEPNVPENYTKTENGLTVTNKYEAPPTPDPDKPNPDKPNPWDPNPWNPDYPKPWNPNYPDLPYIPRYPEIRYETIVQEKIVKVPVPIADNAYIKEVRYMQGFMGDFRPKDGLTRAEAAQILANALVEDGYKYNKDFKLPYKDIGEAWYTRAVKIVTEAKVFAGYDDGNFKPQDKITRNEWIATLKRFQELGDVSGNHMKLKDGHWAMAEIEAAYKEGWLKIYSDGLATYEGDKFIPREEVAAVSNKAFNRVLDKTYIINNDKNLITYKDVKKDMWSYEDILCASNTFLYKKDLYRAHWIKEDNNLFNINTDGFEIVKAKFQRNPR